MNITAYCRHLVVCVGFSVLACAMTSAQSQSSLAKTMAAIDLKAFVSKLPHESEFQSEVRGLFSSLNEPAQRKVTEAIARMRDGRAVVTDSPFDSIVARRLATHIKPLLQAESERVELDAIVANGRLGEILALAQPSASATPSSSLATVPQTKDQSSTKFVSRKYITDAGTVFEFKRNGSGNKTAKGMELPFSWRETEDGIIEASGRDVADGPPKVWFFKFSSDFKTAKYGLSPKTVDWALRVER